MAMKRSWYVSFLALLVGVTAWKGAPRPIYAAGAAQTPTKAAAPIDPMHAEHAPDDAGSAAYAAHCAICHGEQREGILPSFPPLAGVGRHMTDAQVTEIVAHGKGRMPAFPKLKPEELTALLHYLASSDLSPAATTATAAHAGGVHDSGPATAGGSLFQQNCAFCHGRDAGGGESGPDLTRSKLVLADVNADKIGDIVKNGRIEKKMPAFNFSTVELQNVAAFLHSQVAKAVAQKGGRKGVDVSDLQTGDVEAGKRYFNGAGGCAKCHSPTGDLTGIATRYEGLQLEERMLYPRDVKSGISVTLPSGEEMKGKLAYQDEFTIGMRDAKGDYHSWAAGSVKYAIDAPVKAHVEQFPRYTDADIHDLMAYIQTLR
ncbi:MAG: hypothetical protein NVSMB3_03970 [Acidobacteriaceae bacterium]